MTDTDAATDDAESATLPGDRWTDYVRLIDLVGAEVNPKLHDRTGIARSIGVHGLAELPMVDERTGRLIAGHGRLDDLRERRRTGDRPPEGIRVDADGEWLVPVQRGWASRDDEHAAAYLVASNKLTANGGWDLDVLPGFLDDLAGADLLDLTGFSEADLAGLLAGDDTGGTGGTGGEGFTDPDDIPAETDVPAITRPGDLWELGEQGAHCPHCSTWNPSQRAHG